MVDFYSFSHILDHLSSELFSSRVPEQNFFSPISALPADLAVMLYVVASMCESWRQVKYCYHSGSIISATQ